MIGDLVKRDIAKHIQLGLDVIRVYGNEEIHPDEIILIEDLVRLWFCLNL